MEMPPLVGLPAQGIVGIVRRRVGLRLENLVLCNGARGDGAEAPKGRGFYELLCLDQGQRPVLSQQPIILYEHVADGGGLRPYEISSFLSCAAFCADLGLTFFGQGHEIYTLDANNVVRRLFGGQDSVGGTVALNLCFPSALASPDPETLYVTDARGLHVLRLEPSPSDDGIVTVSVNTLRLHEQDEFGQIGIAHNNSSLVSFSATAIYKLEDIDSSWRLWSGNAELGGCVDGDWQQARFSSIIAVTFDSSGAGYVLDAQPDGRTMVRYVDVDGDVKTLFDPTFPDEDVLSGDTDSCSTRPVSPSPWASSCLKEPANEMLEGAFHGGGLRDPMVLNACLALCAPLLDMILFLQLPVACELHCQEGSSPVHASTCPSNPVAPVGALDSERCGYGAYHAGLKSALWSYAETPSCSTSSCCCCCDSGDAINQTGGRAVGRGPSMAENDESQGSYKPAMIELSPTQDDDDEVNSGCTSCTAFRGSLELRGRKRGSYDGLEVKAGDEGRNPSVCKRSRRSMRSA
ncbi:hypothetical protein Vretimale_17096 [Volvox reticuliferus]|uniref:Uncharacterized protein n=1 Tax=Volvox reticuliferus TaxID=1737510 RepID=A0A8J4FXR8_9CHLO|nr:hypothetical protein Vretifemale_18661 [Volvox reticuliferus]GIM14068.1 hypothetical protein Vretimale_17096 [Volvox reticuliferus]